MRVEAFSGCDRQCDWRILASCLDKNFVAVHATDNVEIGLNVR